MAWCCVLTGHVAAQQRQPPPEGVPVGRWVLAPYVESSFESDDNVFRDASAESSDRIRNLTGGLTATLPFSNSLLELDYSATQREYDTHSFARDLVQDASARLVLNFGSRDQLVISDSYRLGISDVREIDAGGEFVFDGQPFNLNRAEVELSRAVPRRRGYLLRAARVDLNFDTADTVPGFFEYRGYEGSLELRQPIGVQRWITVNADWRRFENFDPNCRVVGDDNCDGAFGEPFRQESLNAYQIGLRGFLGPDQPFFVRVGMGDFSYDEIRRSDGAPTPGVDFTGLVASARWRRAIGARTRFDVRADRRPLPSNFDTYYINNQFRVAVERDWLVRSRVTVNMLVGRNRYGDDIPVIDCGGGRREDRRRDVGAQVEWRIHPRVGFELAATHYRRRSNCFVVSPGPRPTDPAVVDPVAKFDATVVTAGIRAGWY